MDFAFGQKPDVANLQRPIVQGATKALEGVLSDDVRMERFVSFLCTEIEPAVLDRIRAESGPETTTLIVSASPMQYVDRFARALGFSGVGSHWQGDSFFHCYGDNKIRYLETHYPPEEFQYNFAITDSPEEKPLLALFRKSVVWKRRR